MLSDTGWNGCVMVTSFFFCWLVLVTIPRSVLIACFMSSIFRVFVRLYACDEWLTYGNHCILFCFVACALWCLLLHTTITSSFWIVAYGVWDLCLLLAIMPSFLARWIWSVYMSVARWREEGCSILVLYSFPVKFWEEWEYRYQVYMPCTGFRKIMYCSFAVFGLQLYICWNGFLSFPFNAFLDLKDLPST